FQKTFPNAIDVEWERKDPQYKVEFETGVLEHDNEAWYDASGKLLRHEEEIPASGLPAAVLAAIQKDFPGFVTDDGKKVTMGGAVSDIVKLKAHKQKLKVVFDQSGKVLEKVGGSRARPTYGTRG